MSEARWERSCYRGASRRSLVIAVDEGQLEVETMHPWLTGIYLHVDHAALGPACTCRAYFGREHASHACDCRPLSGWTDAAPALCELLLAKQPNLDAAAELALAFYRSTECADVTCRHESSEHNPRCEGEYETVDGTRFPCDCFGFRTA